MFNKKGGFGAKFALVLILMLASAVGGAYAYRVLDGKMAVRDAKKAVEQVDISDYDTAEQSVIQGYIDDANKDLDSAKTRKEVYEIIGDFISDVEKVKTKKDKELEEALRAAEEAKQKYENQNNNSAQDSQVGGDTGNTYDTGQGDQGNSENGGDSGYKSNDLTDADDGTTDNGGGFLNSLLGGLASGSGD